MPSKLARGGHWIGLKVLISPEVEIEVESSKALCLPTNLSTETTKTGKRWSFLCTRMTSGGHPTLSNTFSWNNQCPAFLRYFPCLWYRMFYSRKQTKHVFRLAFVWVFDGSKHFFLHGPMMKNLWEKTKHYALELIKIINFEASLLCEAFCLTCLMCLFS